MTVALRLCLGCIEVISDDYCVQIINYSGLITLNRGRKSTQAGVERFSDCNLWTEYSIDDNLTCYLGEVCKQCIVDGDCFQSDDKSVAYDELLLARLDFYIGIGSAQV